eukprot:g1728.t1
MNTIPCIPGTYDHSNGTDVSEERCVQCPEQYFQTELNQASCIACERGRFQNKPGKSFCDQVPSDKARKKVVLSSGRIEYDLVECKPGTMAKNMQCRDCPMGKVQPDAGKSACVQCLSEQYIRIDSVTGKPDRQHCDACPRPGAACNGTNKTYEGNFWHKPSVLNPNTSTNMYACVNDGCPDKGKRVMMCKDGYEGPLCAVCSEGYFPQLRSCTDCGKSGPGWASIAFFCVSLLCVIGLVVMVYKHHRFLASTGVFSHVKILVSFATVMLTVDRQFGITWPPAFQRALAALSVLSLDFGILGSLLCMVDLSFYANLLCTTLMLVALLMCIFVGYLCWRLRHHQATSHHPPDKRSTLVGVVKIKQTCLFVAVYLLLFAYPMVSVKVVELFGCHNVEGTYYLRADYSLECYTPEWKGMAMYAAAFVVTYVVGFPAFVCVKLWSYRHALRKQVQGPGQVCKLAPHGLLLGFLLDDYVLRLPCYMWETEEIVRKLLLSIISNFWSSKSVMCVATALIISLVFQLLHTRLHPFKSPACNRLQQICMSVLNTVYIVGLLVKTEAVTTSDERDVGILLVLLLVSSMLALGCGIVLEILFLRRAWARMRKLTSLLKKLPQQDPPEGSSAFYNIQIPVEESNTGDAFTPKKPEELAHLTEASKLAVVRQLSDENEGVLATFLDRVSHDPMVPLQEVTTPTLVHREGQMCVEWGRKTEESIIKKACRPEIRTKNPDFGIEHLRDTFRFRATVFSFRDIVEFILAMHADHSLSGRGGLTPGNVDPSGNWLIIGKTASNKRTSAIEKRRSLVKQRAPLSSSAGNVAKLDIEKLVKPRKTGWRFMALDFIMPNHQIVECYIRFFEMFQVADLKPAEYGDKGASVCPELSQHEMFEKWRMHDTSSAEKLQAEYNRDKTGLGQAEFAKKWDVDKQKYGGYDTDDLYGEYERDMAESNWRFDEAFQSVLSHTSELELKEFGRLFTMEGDSTHDAWAQLLNMHTSRALRRERAGSRNVSRALVTRTQARRARDSSQSAHIIDTHDVPVVENPLMKRTGTTYPEFANDTSAEGYASNPMHRTHNSSKGHSGNGRTASVESAVDAETGYTYFYNKFTGKSHWDPKSASRRGEKASVGLSDAGATTAKSDTSATAYSSNPMHSKIETPTESGKVRGDHGRTASVVSAVDPATGHTYFYNKFTGRSEWDAESASRRRVDTDYGLDGEAGSDPAKDSGEFSSSNPMHSGTFWSATAGTGAEALAATTTPPIGSKKGHHPHAVDEPRTKSKSGGTGLAKRAVHEDEQSEWLTSSKWLKQLAADSPFSKQSYYARTRHASGAGGAGSSVLDEAKKWNQQQVKEQQELDGDEGNAEDGDAQAIQQLQLPRQNAEV